MADFQSETLTPSKINGTETESGLRCGEELCGVTPQIEVSPWSLTGSSLPRSSCPIVLDYIVITLKLGFQACDHFSEFFPVLLLILFFFMVDSTTDVWFLKYET